MAADGVVPDVRDGLTPVARRALRALGPQFVQAARIVDAVLGGSRRDGGRRAIYGELVRMARDWELRHPLADGQGNLGSINGDEAGSADYTELRLAPLGGELLGDPPGDEPEPAVLPAPFPNLLVNGSFSVATGPASSIPPHNLHEVAAAAIAYIDDPLIDVDGLMRHLPGPDFPTGGLIDGDGLAGAYASGRGEFAVRARTRVESGPRGDAIVVSELPFMVTTGGRGGVLAQIARGAAKRRTIQGIANLEDHSSEHDGLRLVLTLAPGAGADAVLEQLYAHTELQRTFRIDLVAAVGGGERRLSLRDAISHWVAHRGDVVARATGLRSGERVLELVADDLRALAERHGDERRSEIG